MMSDVVDDINFWGNQRYPDHMMSDVDDDINFWGNQGNPDHITSDVVDDGLICKWCRFCCILAFRK